MLQNAKRSDTAGVTNALTARGITVTPAGKKSIELANQTQAQTPVQQPPRQSIDVSSLNLSSAISIVPAQKKQAEKQQQQVQFAVPQSKQATKPTTSTEIERPPRPPTVDLTQDAAPVASLAKRGRPLRYIIIIITL